jgi:hypothetical protein
MGTSLLGYLYQDHEREEGEEEGTASMKLLKALLMPAYTELQDGGFVESTRSAMLDDETMVQENMLERLHQDAWPPVHFCCLHGRPVWQLEYALLLDPQAMITPAGTDQLLPFHCVCAALREWSSNGGANDSVIMQLLHIHPDAISTPTIHGELPLHFACAAVCICKATDCSGRAWWRHIRARSWCRRKRGFIRSNWPVFMVSNLLIQSFV